MQKLSIVIPVYNEQATIEHVLEKINKASTLGLEKEIILVDDASNDGSIETLKNLKQQDLKIIYHLENQGKGAALCTGFAAATGDVLIIQDADLEYDPNEIEKVIAPIIEGHAHVVYGSRYLNRSASLSFWHSYFNKLYTKLGNLLTKQKITDLMTCYKAFDREVLDKITPLLRSKRFGIEPEITARLSKLNYQIQEVSVSYHPRTHKEGKHMNFQGQIESLWALIKYSLLK